MAYYINQITNNHYNKYKYQYLDHMLGTIDLRQNFWDFNLQLFMVNNCTLPLNSLIGHLSLPYQEIKNITFNLASDQSNVKNHVKHNTQYGKLYEAKFNVDISNNAYLKQDLNNAKISSTFNFEIDPEPISKIKTEIKQEDLDGLITETFEQHWDWQMFYTNTHLINESTTFNNTYGYSMNIMHNAFAKVRIVNAILNNYNINEKPINELLHLQSDTAFKIEEAKITFHYWIESITDEKIFETPIEVDKTFTKDIKINFNKNTLYDFVNNKVVIDSAGVEGFFVPKVSKGYYQLELKISQDNDMVKCIVKNECAFTYNINKPHLDVCSITINDLTGYKIVEF